MRGGRHLRLTSHHYLDMEATVPVLVPVFSMKKDIDRLRMAGGAHHMLETDDPHSRTGAGKISDGRKKCRILWAPNTVTQVFGSVPKIEKRPVRLQPGLATLQHIPQLMHWQMQVSAQNKVKFATGETIIASNLRIVDRYPAADVPHCIDNLRPQ